MENYIVEDKKIAVIGLGYVGLPLAVEFSKRYKVFGFDINQGRVEQLKIGNDQTAELQKVLTQDCSGQLYRSVILAGTHKPHRLK